jgi:hypothetical protein
VGTGVACSAHFTRKSLGSGGCGANKDSSQPPQAHPQKSRRENWVAAAIGGLFLLAGVVTLVKARRARE